MRRGVGNERGDIVVGWLTKLAVVIGIVAVVLFDAISVLRAHYGAQGDADLAANNASTVYASSHDKSAAYAAALDVALPNDETIDKKSFHIDATGSVRLTLVRTASTVVLEHVGPLRKLGVATAAASAAPPASSQ